MKLLITTIAAVVLVGCGPPEDIWGAAGQGDLAVVQRELEKGADVNAGDTYMRTALHFASHNGHIEVAELLLAKGADVNARDALGRTPLDYYIYRWSRNELNDLLRKHGGKTG